jgi:hypothetical protein
MNGKRLFAAGKIGPWPSAAPDLTPVPLEAGTGSGATVHPELCLNGCIGPFTSRPDLTNWLQKYATQQGRNPDEVLPQYDCGNCRTSRGYTPAELKGAA